MTLRQWSLDNDAETMTPTQWRWCNDANKNADDDAADNGNADQDASLVYWPCLILINETVFSSIDVGDGDGCDEDDNDDDDGADNDDDDDDDDHVDEDADILRW